MRYLLPGLIAFAVAVGIVGVLFVRGGETAPPDEEIASEGLTLEEQEIVTSLENAKDNAISLEGIPASLWDDESSYVVPLELDSGAFLSREAAEEKAAHHYPNVSLLDVVVGRFVEPVMGRDRPVWAFSLDPQDKDLIPHLHRPGETVRFLVLFIDAETGDYVSSLTGGRCAPPGCIAGPAPEGPAWTPQPLSPPPSGP